MPDIKKILFPVDFSESCYGAARHVEAMAGRFEAEVMLLHAVGMGEHNLAEELLPGRQARLNGFLAEDWKQFATSRICIAGDAAHVIVDTARSWRPDLVMIPTHGLGLFRRMLLGSVTAKVLHDLDCPVWTSVHSETTPVLEDIHCRKVLCAVDLGERSRSVLEWAKWIAGEYGAVLGIAHATRELPPEYEGWKFSGDFSRAECENAMKGIEVLQLEAGTSAETLIRAGNSARTIAAAVREFSADILVIGRHDNSGLGGYLQHHAYAIARESPCPVVSI